MRRIYSITKSSGFLFLVILFSITYQLRAQSVSGNVKDANSNINIPDSKVQIKNLDNGITDSVFTNSTENWYYTLITSVENDDLTIPN
ncbi:MAG: hypothetical protein R6W68_02435, partial [Ignavibacteriaceae bacterium]